MPPSRMMIRVASATDLMAESLPVVLKIGGANQVLSLNHLPEGLSAFA